MTSIAAEVAWTKYLSIVTGTTLYGFAAILTVFLSGIAAGAWLARRAGVAARDRLVWLGRNLILLAALMVLSRAALGLGPYIQGARIAAGVPASLRAVLTYGYLAAVLLPPTLLFGALFPRALDVYCGSALGVRARAGTAYAVNTFAGIAGSLLAGFVLIPTIGTDRVLGVLAATLCLAGLPLALTRARGRTRAATALAAAGVLAAAAVAPGLDYRALINAVAAETDPLRDRGESPLRFLYLKEGRGGVISVVTRDGRLAAVQSNGLTESHLDMLSPRNAPLTESLLGLVPYLLHPEPRRALVVGFGGGNTAYALTTTFWLQEIDVVELEPEIVSAVRAVLNGPPPALLDPRLNLQIGDARNRLLVGEGRYDIIVSQPSHPWLAGASGVFSREFFEIALSRLEPDGIFSQWLNLFRMDATTLRSILAAFYETFRHGFVLVGSGAGELLLIGSPEPVTFERERVSERMAKAETRALLKLHGVDDTADLLVLYGFSRAGALEAAAGHEPNTDTNLLSEIRLAALRGGAGEEAEDAVALVERTRTSDSAGFVAPPWRPELMAELARRRHQPSGP